MSDLVKIPYLHRRTVLRRGRPVYLKSNKTFARNLGKLSTECPQCPLWPSPIKTFTACLCICIFEAEIEK